MQLMLALYDYTPATESPNPQPELELSFKKDQVLTIYGDMVCSPHFGRYDSLVPIMSQHGDKYRDVAMNIE